MKKYFDELPLIYALFILLCYLLGVGGWVSSILYDYSWSFLLFSALLTLGSVFFVIATTNPDVDDVENYGYNFIRLLMLPFIGTFILLIGILRYSIGFLFGVLIVATIVNLINIYIWGNAALFASGVLLLFLSFLFLGTFVNILLLGTTYLYGLYFRLDEEEPLYTSILPVAFLWYFCYVVFTYQLNKISPLYIPLSDYSLSLGTHIVYCFKTFLDLVTFDFSTYFMTVSDVQINGTKTTRFLEFGYKLMSFAIIVTCYCFSKLDIDEEDFEEEDIDDEDEKRHYIVLPHS